MKLFELSDGIRRCYGYDHAEHILVEFVTMLGMYETESEFRVLPKDKAWIREAQNFPFFEDELLEALHDAE